tara:strand:+ start:491 stop:1117 length:627 start_codon:yes stop_codon:yes gene_type:complete
MAYTGFSEVDSIKDRTNILLYEHSDYGRTVVPSIPHKDREYGGHLMICTPDHIKVSHSHQLYRMEPRLLHGFNTLVMITEMAMLDLIADKLSDGREGVVNIFDAGNWQFHTDRYLSQSAPVGIEKDGSFKTLHVHMYGRSPLEPAETEVDKILHWGWGEAPYFPRFHETPFAPEKVGKDWIVPDQFNEEEVDFFEKRLKELAQKTKWP